jgi:opacity protein-like surface antigen
MMKKYFALLFILFCAITQAQTKLFQPGWQFSIGTGTNLDRWDKGLDSLNTFFQGDPNTLGAVPAQPALRIYNKPSYNLELNYIHNLQSRFTWKAGINAGQQKLSYTLGDSYVDSNSIKLSSAGLHALAICSFHPSDGSTLMIGIGAGVQGLLLKDNEIYSLTDTILNISGVADLYSESTLKMNLTSSVVIQGIAQIEWINKLNEKWSISASAQARFPFNDYFTFSGESNITSTIEFFGQTITTPISSTTRTSSPGNMPYWQFNIGIVRLLEMKRIVSVDKAL